MGLLSEEEGATVGGGIVWEISLKSDSELSRGLEFIHAT